MIKYDIGIIGGGPAGMAAAISAYNSGAKKVAIFERDTSLGGVLWQCIHNGFGLTRFKENLTGPEYSEKFYSEVKKLPIDVFTETMVLSFESGKIRAMNKTQGIFDVEVGAIILAMGSRERSRGALTVQGERPSGVFSAGTAQRYMNIKGYSVGKKAVIVGSGDIGLIMARRLILEGTKVEAVCEIMPFSSGLRRNIIQCLEDYNIPLHLSHTVIEIKGKDRVEGVVIAKVDENKNPIPGTEFKIECDTLLYSVGLIPENELTKDAGVSLCPRTKGAVVDQFRETDMNGVFSCGNVLHVHDLVDFVSEEGETAGKYATEYVLRGKREKKYATTVAGKGIGYTLPQKIDVTDSRPFKIYFRVREEKSDAVLRLSVNGKTVREIKKERIAPGEMEYIPFIAKDIAEGDVVTVEVL